MCERLCGELQGLRLGKRLPTALYVHRSLIVSLPQIMRALVSGALEERTETVEWNVFKFALNGTRLSLLNYPGFDEEAFPRLRRSVSYALSSGTCSFREYAQDDRAFVLHRKELFVSGDYPLRDEFELITREVEDAGLLRDTSAIGRLGQWKKRLADGGFVLLDG